MNFHQLKYILSVNAHRNFARAAEECEIAQSTLSKEIQRLEKEFGIMIFDRSRHPVVPTLKGIDLLKQAKLILEEQEKFMALARQKDNRPSGDYKLGILSGLAPYLLPLFAQQFSRKYPEVSLTFIELSLLEMTEQLEGGLLDGAIGIDPFPKEGFYEASLFEEEFVLYVSSDHRLSQVSVVNWSDIPLEELILQEDMKTYFLEQKKGLMRSRRLGASINFKNGSLETLRKIIDGNGGITLLPQLACLYMGDRRREMIRHIQDPVLSRTISFIAPRGFEKNRISKVIQKEIINSIPQHICARQVI